MQQNAPWQSVIMAYYWINIRLLTCHCVTSFLMLYLVEVELLLALILSSLYKAIYFMS